MPKKQAIAALQKMHCCNAAFAVEKLGDRAQLGCNAGPNLLPWISVEFWRRTILLVRRLFFSQET
ncbi:hypothetical protein C1J03_17005 [Sulfitobacter sp. SK012]|nr:hypothetical protein C1J03_17005 [Sulfitobacter sp. SK012]